MPGNSATSGGAIEMYDVVGAVQTHTAPYRLAFDSHSALAAVWLLFMWPFVLLVRHSEAVSGEYGVALGAVLIAAATMVMVAFVACALAMGFWKNSTASETDPAVASSEAVSEEGAAAQRTTERPQLK